MFIHSSTLFVHLFIHPSIYALTQPLIYLPTYPPSLPPSFYSLIHSSILPNIHIFIIHPLILSSKHLLAYSFIQPTIRTSIYISIHLLIIHSFNYSSFIHSHLSLSIPISIHPFTFSSTHSFIHPSILVHACIRI